MSDSKPTSPAQEQGKPSLDTLAKRIRDAQETIEAAHRGLREGRRTHLCNALHTALNAGDDLVAAQDQVAARGWSCWLRENCCLRRRTALLYMQLSRSRSVIEAAIDDGKCLSLRAALKLITRVSKPKLKRNLDGWSNDEVIAALAAKFRTAKQFFEQGIPPEWRPDSQLLAGGQALTLVRQRHPNKRARDLSRKDLAGIVAAEVIPFPTAH
jgi:hypothetical protein